MIGITYLRFCRGVPGHYSLEESMTSFPDYGLKAQGIERHGAHDGYRSVFQPYAGMYVVFWYVCISQLYGMIVI
jgi:hypothetical protein